MRELLERGRRDKLFVNLADRALPRGGARVELGVGLPRAAQRAVEFAEQSGLGNVAAADRGDAAAARQPAERRVADPRDREGGENQPEQREREPRGQVAAKQGDHGRGS